MSSDNQSYWNTLAALHSGPDGYPIQDVLRGATTLRHVETEILDRYASDSDLTILHSHCHIGLDSICLARTYSSVTGVDYSSNAIETAIQLASRSNQSNCSFIEGDTSSIELSDHVEPVDIYYATYGVLVWVENLTNWFKVASRILKPGGILILIDEHPVAATLSGSQSIEHLDPVAPYFREYGPYLTENSHSYTGQEIPLTNRLAQTKFPHALEEIFLAAKRSGLHMEEFREYTFAHYNAVNLMFQNDDGYFHHKKYNRHFPFSFSAVFRKNQPD